MENQEMLKTLWENMRREQKNDMTISLIIRCQMLQFLLSIDLRFPLKW